MDKTNTLTDLVVDLFDFLVETYDIVAVQESHVKGNTLPTKLAKLFQDDTDALFSPCIVLLPTSRVSLELRVLKRTPSIETSSMGDDYLKVCTTYKETNVLSVSSGEWLGGFPCLRMTDDESLSKLRLTILNKIHELYYSGKYNTDPVPVKNREPLSV